LEKGYVVQRIYEVWHFDETEQYDPKTKTGGLFTDYVNTFLKMKQEASGSLLFVVVSDIPPFIVFARTPLWPTAGFLLHFEEGIHVIGKESSSFSTL
jgi:hypothetical protein